MLGNDVLAEATEIRHFVHVSWGPFTLSESENASNPHQNSSTLIFNIYILIFTDRIRTMGEGYAVTGVCLLTEGSASSQNASLVT